MKNLKLIEQRADIIYQNVGDIIDGRLNSGHPPSPDYLDALIYGYSIINRKISRIHYTFKNHMQHLKVDACSVQATIEDLVGIYGIYIPGGEDLLDIEEEIIDDLNDRLANY